MCLTHCCVSDALAAVCCAAATAGFAPGFSSPSAGLSLRRTNSTALPTLASIADVDDDDMSSLDSPGSPKSPADRTSASAGRGAMELYNGKPRSSMGGKEATMWLLREPPSSLSDFNLTSPQDMKLLQAAFRVSTCVSSGVEWSTRSRRVEWRAVVDPCSPPACATDRPSLEQVVLSCLSYDFSGGTADPETEELHPIPIPSSWSIVKNEGPVHLAFDLLAKVRVAPQFGGEDMPTATIVECLVQVRGVDVHMRQCTRHTLCVSTSDG